MLLIRLALSILPKTRCSRTAEKEEEYVAEQHLPSRQNHNLQQLWNDS